MLQPHTSHLFQPWGFHVVGGIENPVLCCFEGRVPPYLLPTRSTVQVRLLLLLCGQASPRKHRDTSWQQVAVWQTGSVSDDPPSGSLPVPVSQCPSVPLAPTHPPETNMKAHGDKVWQMLESRKAGQHTFLRRGPFMTLSTPVVSRY